MTQRAGDRSTDCRPRDHEAVRVPDTGPPRARLESGAPVLPLDGRWRFALHPAADTGADPADPGTGWGGIDVPGHWQLQGHGSPAYTNVVYPFPVDVPFVPDDNPTGEYRLAFDLPADWPAGRTLLRFDGVDSWMRVWVNGTDLGQSSGSRLTAEFDATAALVPGRNLLAVRVHQWSFGSYVEDQDQWWLSGIFRSVALLARPDGGVEDVFVRAGYDAATGEGVLRVDVTTAPQAGPVTVRLEGPDPGGRDLAVPPGAEVRVPGVRPWSAEDPALYGLTVATPAETVRLRAGFRTVATAGGVLTLNGAPLVLRGVNRHDSDPERGRAVTRAAMRRDVLLMKRHNINALRTSHYPPDPHLLELCDELGLYVIEECDIETHGFEFTGWEGNPSDDPRFAAVYLDRARRMVERDKNHPCVVSWSLGNEAGTGRNLAANAAWIRGRDPGRPVHYEPDADCAYTDLYSRMYAGHGELRAIGEGTEPPAATSELDARRRTLPMVQCEYAHAMGNGPGGLAEYEEIFDRHPRLAGGFVWEWADHGLPRPGHGTSWGYGGDFGEPLHDGSFVIDGLVLPDRTPSPALAEYAAVIAPLRFRFEEPGTVTVVNRTAFTPAGHWSARAAVTAGGREIAAAPLELAAAPGGTARIPLPAPVLAAAGRARAGEYAADGEVWLTVTAAEAADRPWAPAGHVVAAGQSRLPSPPPAPPATVPGGARRAGEGFTVAGARFGADGRPVEVPGLPGLTAALTAWRAPTENDGHPGIPYAFPLAGQWRAAGLDRLTRRLVRAGTAGDRLVVATRWMPAGAAHGLDATACWSDTGRGLRLELEVRAFGGLPMPLPRLGVALSWADPRAAEREVAWFGAGPGESYPDSRAAALTGRWSAPVAALQTPYVVPQENGHRSDVRWAEVGLPGGTLRIDAAEPAGLTVRPWSTAALAAAAHTDELAPDGRLHLTLDTAQQGVGTATCGPGVLPEHRFATGRGRLDITFRTYS